MADEDKDRSLSPLDLISAGRWQRALFTSYVLSVTYFETYVLPRLRRTGCQKVCVLVDAKGYRTSLMELRARHVGQEYSLVPVEVRSPGIFHPKISYLWGDEGDLLMVGSGNLTFGGYGQNVEVLEALASGTDAAAFGDFAQMCSALLARTDARIGNTEALQEFQARAAKNSKHAGASGATRLLHSISTPIAQQVVDIAKPLGAWGELLVLSPFHNNDGEPVRYIAEQLGMRRISIGVPGSPDDGFSFPFEKASAWNASVRAVTPNVEKPNRKLHAKWLELRGARTLAVTGSVNATFQSMRTTDNVEVAVLRYLEKPTTENWKEAERPRYEPNRFDSYDSTALLPVFAELDTNGTVGGSILGTKNAEGVWDASLEWAEEIKATTPLSVDAHGRFAWKIEHLFEFDASSCAQIRLLKDGVEARGWITVEALLRLPSRARVAVGALGRMLSRSESNDDVHAILDYIAIYSGQLAAQPPMRRSPSRESGDKTEPDATVHISELFRTDDTHRDLTLHDFAAVAGHESQTWEILQTVVRMLLGRKLSTTSNLRRPNRPGDGGSAVEDDEDAQQEKEIYDALSEFDDKLRDAIDAPQIDVIRRAQLLFVWGNVGLEMRLRRVKSPDAAQQFAKEWLLCALRANLTAEVRPVLDATVFGVASALALHTNERAERPFVGFGLATTRQQIHEWLEAYCAADVDPEYARRAAASWLEHETPQLLVGGNSEGALAALHACLESRTIRAVLRSYCREVETGVPPLVPDGWFTPEELTLLRAIRPSTNGRKGYFEVNHRSPRGCPKCYHTLHTDTLTRLRHRRIDKCVHCNAVLLVLEP